MLRANTQSINNGQSVSSPQIMSMVHQHLAHYFVRSLREGRIGNVQGMADVKAALRSEDGRAFEAAMYCLPPEQIDRLRGFKNFPKAIHRVINNLLDDFAYVGERAGLFSAYHLATTALEFGFAWDKRNGSNTNYLIENLIKQRQGSFAARLVTLSIQNGLRLPERLILSSLVVAAKEARRPTHLMNYAHLALVAAERGMINFADPKVNRVYDVVLALLGTPSNLGSRVNQVYEDKSDIIDLGRRLKLAGEIGIAALEGGVRFDVQRSERRINMLARALVTGSAKLDCTAEYLERRHKDGYLSRTKVRELQKEYRIGTQSFGLRIPNRNADPQVLRKEVDVMLGMSLELLNQSIVWTNG
ncbi:MAG: hypothetical protein KDD62_10285, partial [Bdellovibrionales bacterium]|nr:hypothetical protein [Bdellovibrionales bacterium]